MVMLAGHRFRPALWPTLMVIPALLILVALGTWQLQRLEWKTALIDRIEHGMAVPPVTMPATFDDPAAWDYRAVTVEGEFLHDRELPVGPRTWRGRVGYHIVTPLLRTDRPDAPAVLVNRGWVPNDRLDPATRTDGLPAGRVTVQGVLRLPAEQGWLQPDNDPVANRWFWTDPAAMAEQAGLDAVAPLVLEAGAGSAPETLPIGGQTRVDIPNNHLHYALTWYGLAVVLAVIYIAAHLRRPHRAEHERS